jgi:hypothetical protein
MHEKNNSNSSCRSGVAFSKQAQFNFRNNEFSHTTIQADNHVGEYPDNGFVNVLQTREMDTHLRSELAMVY